MVMPATFQEGTDWQQSSEPLTHVEVQESDCWPVDDRSGSGTKDQLAPGLHPVVAIGGRTAADGRPFNLTGVVVNEFLLENLLDILLSLGSCSQATSSHRIIDSLVSNVYIRCVVYFHYKIVLCISNKKSKYE